jgi:hypothetical protein
MSRFRLLIAALALIGGSAFTTPAIADGPTYLILRGPKPGKSDHSLHVLQPQPYAYGWFGAQPRYRFRTKSNGYYGSYTQWSYR